MAPIGNLPCGLFYPEKHLVLGGRDVGFPANLRTEFVMFPGDSASFGDGEDDKESTLHISICFLRDTFDIVSSEQLADDDHRTLLHREPGENRMSVTHLKLKSGRRPIFVGLGIPFRGIDTKIDGYINKGTKIDNVSTLYKVVSQRDFHIFSSDSELAGKITLNFENSQNRVQGSTYRFGNLHAWDLSRYDRQLSSQSAADEQYKVPEYHQDKNACLTSLAMSVVQDNHFTITNVAAIRKLPLKCRFIYADNEGLRRSWKGYFVVIENGQLGGHVQGPDVLDGEASDHLVIKVRSPDSFSWRGHAQPQFYNAFEDDDPFPDTVYVSFYDFSDVAKQRVDTANDLFDFDSSVQGALDLAKNYHKSCLNWYLRDFMEGHSFTSALKRPPLPTIADDREKEALMSQLATMALGNRLLIKAPRIDILRHSNKARSNAILCKMLPVDSRERLCRYLDFCVLGLVGISGFAGSGKTRLLAIVALLFNACPTVDHVYISAPSRVAVKNIAMRIRDLGIELVRNGVWGSPFVLHGRHSLKKETDNFFFLIRNHYQESSGPTRTQRSAKDDLTLSPCEWLFKVVGFGSYALAYHDRAEVLLTMRQKFRAHDDYKRLRHFVRGKVQDADREPQQWSLVEALLQDLVNGADFVATTPHASGNSLYKEYRDNSDAVVFDEAGGLHKTDALMVWGPTCRMCAMAGDEKQLGVVVSEHKRNNFARHAAVSILQHLKNFGYPCLVLNKQERIVHGLFDVARDLIYPHIEDVTYAESTQLVNNPVASQLKTWSEDKYSLTSPKGKVLPVFLECEGKCVTDENGSRWNDKQNEVAVDLVRDMLNENEGVIAPENVVVITPYDANLWRLRKAIRRGVKNGDRVIASTIDAFQGQEGQVVVLVLAVNQKSGPGFMVTKSRICLSITRHTSALFVVGDTIVRDDRVEEDSVFDLLPELQMQEIDHVRDLTNKHMVTHVGFETLEDLFRYFKRKNRVYRVQ
ncbi:hypothetical protein G7054_g4913 [Neopestalotiopsis clavispora]|nr:hypothetical protein G7054_g4913 [Neopestalotiopsis clavispora]